METWTSATSNQQPNPMLPAWLQSKLASPPPAGSGVHAWLFSVARQLHAHMPPEAIIAALAAATTNVGRRVTHREIHDAVRNSFAVAWQPKPQGTVARGGANRINHRREHGEAPAPGPPLSPLPRWPTPDPVVRRCRIADAAHEGVATLHDLWENSPVHPAFTVDDWLDWLFPGAAWLCLAVDHPATARSRRREKWTFGPAEQCGLIVPSPMTGPSGQGLDGRPSHRCLANTAPRRWLVIEFDSGTIDEQAALHWHLRAAAEAASWPRLTLRVHSGGKSLHGWYGVCHDEENTRELMAYAVSLGADPATWNRCQLVRLPGGVRQASVTSAKHCRQNPGASAMEMPLRGAEHRTSNIEHPTSNRTHSPRSAHSMFEVGRSMFDVLPAAGGSPSHHRVDHLRQEVFHFNPAQCLSPINSSAPGGQRDSMPPRAPTVA